MHSHLLSLTCVCQFYTVKSILFIILIFVFHQVSFRYSCQFCVFVTLIFFSQPEVPKRKVLRVAYVFLHGLFYIYIPNKPVFHRQTSQSINYTGKVHSLRNKSTNKFKEFFKLILSKNTNSLSNLSLTPMVCPHLSERNLPEKKKKTEKYLLENKNPERLWPEFFS